MNFDYLALIVGGIGPNVWDKEVSINAADFMDAAGQAQAKADEFGGQVVMLEQNDMPAPAIQPELKKPIPTGISAYRDKNGDLVSTYPTGPKRVLTPNAGGEATGAALCDRSPRP